MATRTMSITEFKAHLLRVATEVEATGDAVVVTRRGKPILKVTPADDAATGIDLRGSLILPDDLSLLDSAFDDVDPDWELQGDGGFWATPAVSGDA